VYGLCRNKNNIIDNEVKHLVKYHSVSQIAKDSIELQKLRVEAGQIAPRRITKIESAVRAQLNPYMGPLQINLIGRDRGMNFPLWRQKTWKEKLEREREELKKQGKEPKERPARVSDASIRSEMEIFRSIMSYAAGKKYIPDMEMFKGKLPLDKVRREEFTPEEYRKLHTYARAWIKKARAPVHTWYRTVAYNFILIMCNTGMRPTEAKNLLWRDVAINEDGQGRKFVVLRVRGKDKFRQLVAASNVADYLERVRALSKATKPDDFVFTTAKGKRAPLLYRSLIVNLFTESGLRLSSSGGRRSTYCFRHTYATFRLSEGVDVYFLAKQMGTSVKMIEEHYGNINPVKNAERILQGMPGWEPIATAPQLPAQAGRVNAVAAKARAARSKPMEAR
jgi:integrase